jgi:ligand-binding sensor domain-containing protein
VKDESHHSQTLFFVKLNRLTGELIHVYDRINSMLQGMEITDIAIAPDGTKWIGTPQGLFRIRGGVWTLFNTKEGLPSSNISTLTLDNSGLPIAGTLFSGLGFFSAASNSFSSINTASTPELPSDEILDLDFDIENDWLWIATYNGLARRSAGQWQVWDNTTGLPSNWITSVYCGPAPVKQVWPGFWTGLNGSCSKSEIP